MNRFVTTIKDESRVNICEKSYLFKITIKKDDKDTIIEDCEKFCKQIGINERDFLKYISLELNIKISDSNKIKTKHTIEELDNVVDKLINELVLCINCRNQILLYKTKNDLWIRCDNCNINYRARTNKNFVRYMTREK